MVSRNIRRAKQKAWALFRKGWQTEGYWNDIVESWEITMHAVSQKMATET